MAISIKAARVNANLTQSEAATSLGISKNTLVSYENGKSIPKIDLAQRMASLYGFTVDQINFLPSNCALSAEQ